MAVSRRICFFFQKIETPMLIVFWGCALFGPSCQEREILDTHPKKKILTDNWISHFWVFLGFSYFFPFFLFCVFLVFVFFCYSLFFFKGQVRWPPRRAPWLGPKSSLFVFLSFFLDFFVFFGPFLSLILIEKPCFPLEGAFCFYFWVSPFVSP